MQTLFESVLLFQKKYKAKQKLYKASGISIALYSLFFNYSQKRF